MKKEKVLKSELKKSNLIILSLGGILLTFFGIKLTILGIEKNTLLFISIPILFFGLVSIYHLLNYNILEISENKLVVKTLVGITKKSIKLSEITSYNEIEKENAKYKHELAHMKWKDLTLFGKNFKYKISSSSYNNYAELRKSLIRQKKRNIKSENEWQRKNSLYYGIGFLIFGIILSIWFGKISKNFNEELLSVGFSSLFIIFGIYLITKNRKAYR
ncbi:MAG: hypothetical protein ABJQ39_00435 [Winogradskyella arenosi]